MGSFNLVEIVKKSTILDAIRNVFNTPFGLITTILDLLIVFFLAYHAFKILKETRAWQLLKGIITLLIVTFISDLVNFKILNYILTSLMSYGVIMIIIILQPELRRALEQLGTSKFKRFLGIEDDEKIKTKENIYKIAIAATELSKAKKGALIVIEREIKIHDIVATGIAMNSEISPQLLVNIFEPKTPLHDGAVVISDNKISAAACMLPLSDDKDIARELGTRHRAAIGISKESDALAVVVSEETGRISIAKDGTLIADVREDVLKKILIKNLIVEYPVPQKKKEEPKKAESLIKTDKKDIKENK